MQASSLRPRLPPVLQLLSPKRCSLMQALGEEGCFPQKESLGLLSSPGGPADDANTLIAR
jgi:hypothetical protein